jgi:hypothetical protein
VRHFGLGQRAAREQSDRENGHEDRHEDRRLAQVEVEQRAVGRRVCAEQQALREPEHVQRAQHDAGHRDDHEHELEAVAREVQRPGELNAPSNDRNSPANRSSSAVRSRRGQQRKEHE